MRISFFVLFCGAAFWVNGQQNYCGTVMPEHMISWLDNYKSKSHPSHKQQDEASLKYIPLKIHLVGSDEGDGFHKLQYILDGLCRLNSQFEQVGFYFYIHENIDYISSTALNNHDEGYGQVIGSTLRDDAANIYYVDNANGNCGYYSGWGDFVVIANSCAGPYNSTVAHELGHYFDLPHTFNGWENRASTAPARATDERVNGSNCTTAGDRFCDTPADYLSDRWNCPYRETKLDYNGDPYNVDGSLFMSYANDGCQNRFSAEQIDVMRAYVNSERRGLLSLPVPVLDSVGKPQAVYPAHNSVNIPENFVQLKWRKVNGATHYHLQVSRYSTIFNVDTIVQDTSVILTSLESPYNYKWRVRPFNQGYTCTEYTSYWIFTTRAASPIVPNYIITDISCAGEADGSIAVGASGGTQPYSFRWSTGVSGQMITNLAAGNYMLTISEAGEDSLIISFDISAPEPLSMQIEQAGNVLIAIASGGTPPFNYQWSNGSTSSQNSVADAGSYSVTLTDSRGCSVTKSFFFTGISDMNAADVRIYPNPLLKDERLTLEIAARQAFKGTIAIFDNTGRKVSEHEKLFTSAITRQSFDLPGLPAGIYMLRVTGGGVNFTKKLVMMSPSTQNN